MNPQFKHVALVGTGAMGQGIAQLCAQAGSNVYLFDTQEGAAQRARTRLESQWLKLVEKNKISNDDAQAYLSRLQVIGSLQDLSKCDLVVEAILEQLPLKQALFKSLEEICAPSCRFASNTSSLSITSIASGMKEPSRLAGFHFFNPVPLMRVIEVVKGLKTDPALSRDLLQYGSELGHTTILTQDTPGFVINHAGRAFPTEALRILSESVSDHATIDAILKDQVGFKLGPFELMDLTSLDVSHPVMESIYHQYFEEPRYRPNYITTQRLAGGMVGKKVGEGFYRYVDGLAQYPELSAGASESVKADFAKGTKQLVPVWIHPKAARYEELKALLLSLGAQLESAPSPSEKALCIVAPLGLDVSTCAVLFALDPSRTIGIDMLVPDAKTKRRVICTNPSLRHDMLEQAQVLLGADAKPVSTLRDSAGFVTQRVLACIVNIASDICQQSVCSPKDLDLAVPLGLGYPKGPLTMGDELGVQNVFEILFNMQTVYGDPRYRPSPWLRRRAALGLSLLHEEIQA
jgi:3-hydroxybutyryl-CoA dehydrogenase